MASDTQHSDTETATQPQPQGSQTPASTSSQDQAGSKEKQDDPNYNPDLEEKRAQEQRDGAGSQADVKPVHPIKGFFSATAGPPVTATGELLDEHDIEKVQRKNDLLKTNEERAAEGEAQLQKRTEDGKIVLTERAGYMATGFAFPRWKKWGILTVIFFAQLSFNGNTSVYPNAVTGITEKFGVSEAAARVGQMIFLVAYAFGCELWAPWSEEIGRWPVLQLSLFLVNLTQILAALAPNFGSLIVARFLGGLLTAGGSVTLGMVADLFEPDEQQYAVAFVVFSSVGGTWIGPFCGAFLEHGAPLIWIFWWQMIFGFAVQIVHFFTVPETRSTILLDREAKRRRAAGEQNIWGPNEVREDRFSLKEIGVYWMRPFEMFVREPIVLFLSLLSGFSDMLIFIFLESFKLVYGQWGLQTIGVGLAFLPIIIGYLISWALFIPRFIYEGRIRRKDKDALQPEARLWLLLFLAPLEPIGLFGFAWCSLGPPHVQSPWGNYVFSCLIAIANYAIYMACIDYTTAAYGEYAASATGGNALARDFLAGISALYAAPMYNTLGNEWASTLLGFLGIAVVFPVYYFYWRGHLLREKSKFAQSLANDRAAHGGRPNKDDEKSG